MTFASVALAVKIQQFLKAFGWLAVVVLLTSSTQKTSPLEGTWYGLYNKSIVEVTMGSDFSFHMLSEAGSNLTQHCKYRINDKTTPMQIDLYTDEIGTAAAGVYRINPDRTVDMNIVFGIPGMVPRPASVDEYEESITNIHFRLTKDKESLLAEIAPKVKALESAGLAFERNERLGKGINLNAVVDGNLHPGYERDAPLADSEIKYIADAGFQSVRLNVCWAKHASFEKPYTIDPEFFKKVDHIVDECLENDLAVSIDMHYYPYINMDNEDKRISYEDNYEHLYSFWEQLAEHYKDYPSEVYFDLLNEPNYRMGSEKWNEVLNKLIKIVRKTNPDRTLLVQTPNMGQSWTLNLLELPEDDWNIIVEFHYYLPHLFTHNGLSYAMAAGSQVVTWMGTESDKAPIESDLDFCQKWSETHGRPVNMGEYGAVNTTDEASRARYLGFMSEAAAKRGISSHLWGYRECFQIRNEETGEWTESILDALNLR